jgi:hypothetical protein
LVPVVGECVGIGSGGRNPVEGAVGEWFTHAGVAPSQSLPTVRALDPTGRLDDPFVDDDDSIFEHDIDRLDAAGVTRGCSPPANGRFCPRGSSSWGGLCRRNSAIWCEEDRSNTCPP